jgi:hypothetical protein
MWNKMAITTNKDVGSLFNPDESGISEWVTREQLLQSGCDLGNNGCVRRGIPERISGAKKYIWEFERGTNNKLLALRTIGFNKQTRLNQTISSAIKLQILKKGYCNISMMPFSDDLEVDHRWGYKDHPKYNHINDTSKQRVEDFQPLCRSLNLKKRQMCKVCIETKIRPKHPQKEFVVGNEILDDEIVCGGCPWAQPELYR